MEETKYIYKITLEIPIDDQTVPIVELMNIIHHHFSVANGCFHISFPNFDRVIGCIFKGIEPENEPQKKLEFVGED